MLNASLIDPPFVLRAIGAASSRLPHLQFYLENSAGMRSALQLHVNSYQGFVLRPPSYEVACEGNHVSGTVMKAMGAGGLVGLVAKTFDIEDAVGKIAGKTYPGSTFNPAHALKDASTGGKGRLPGAMIAAFAVGCD